MAWKEINPHRCSVCSCDYTDDEGGIQGYFGILPVSFCPTCFSCMCDMASQYLDDDQLNEEHEQLIEHLRGYKEIVINECHGGFSLSRDAEIAWLERTATPYVTIPRDDRHSDMRYGPHIIVNNKHWYSNQISRDDTTLVQIVRELGQNSWGHNAKLKIVKVPADVEWQIDEYDGNEWVSEKHRTWD